MILACSLSAHWVLTARWVSPRVILLLLAPDKGEDRVLWWTYLSEFVCLCFECLSTSTSDLHHICSVYWPWLVLLWWRCDTLCTSGFMDDVIFAHNGPYWRMSILLQQVTPLRRRAAALGLLVAPCRRRQALTLRYEGAGGEACNASLPCMCMLTVKVSLGLSLAALRYVMFFRFYGWRHVFT